MQKNISVSYTHQSLHETYAIVVTYQIEQEGNISLISCSVSQEDPLPVPQWLQLKKFEVRTLFAAGVYIMLYNEKNHHSNLDTSLFIDKAYDDIMHEEKMILA